MARLFTILDTKGDHGNIRVNILKNNIKDLKVYPIFPTEERNILFKVLRKYFRTLFVFYRNKKAIKFLKKQNDTVFLSFSGEFCELYDKKMILDIDDPYYTQEEIDKINNPNVIAVIVTTEQMKAQYKEKLVLNKPIHVVPTPVEFKIENKSEDKNLNKFRAIYYATFITNEEVDLINSISDRMSNIKNFEMIVIGKSTIPINKKNIIRHSSVPHAKLYDFLSSSDLGLYLRTEDRENRLSVKIIEMMSMGLPTIATDVSEAFPIIENNCGYSIHPKKIPDKIFEIYTDRNLVSGFSENAIEGSKKYKLENIIDKYENILNLYL